MIRLDHIASSLHPSFTGHRSSPSRSPLSLVCLSITMRTRTPQRCLSEGLFWVVEFAPPHSPTHPPRRKISSTPIKARQILESCIYPEDTNPPPRFCRVGLASQDGGEHPTRTPPLNTSSRPPGSTYAHLSNLNLCTTMSNTFPIPNIVSSPRSYLILPVANERHIPFAHFPSTF